MKLGLQLGYWGAQPNPFSIALAQEAERLEFDSLCSDLPILLGAEGPKNIELAAEIADGWLPLYYSPFRQDVYSQSLKRAEGKPEFEVCVNVMGCRIVDDIEEALVPTKAALAFYI